MNLHLALKSKIENLRNLSKVKIITKDLKIKISDATLKIMQY